MKNVTYASSYAISLVETGKNIRSLRIRNGLSVMDVSDFFGGIARNSIYKWERGETLPCIDNLYALAGLFRVSLDGLIVGNRETVDRGDGDQSVEPKILTGTLQNTPTKTTSAGPKRGWPMCLFGLKLNCEKQHKNAGP